MAQDIRGRARGVRALLRELAPAAAAAAGAALGVAAVVQISASTVSSVEPRPAPTVTSAEAPLAESSPVTVRVRPTPAPPLPPQGPTELAVERVAPAPPAIAGARDGSRDGSNGRRARGVPAARPTPPTSAAGSPAATSPPAPPPVVDTPTVTAAESPEDECVRPGQRRGDARHDREPRGRQCDDRGRPDDRGRDR